MAALRPVIGSRRGGRAAVTDRRAGALSASNWKTTSRSLEYRRGSEEDELCLAGDDREEDEECLECRDGGTSVLYLTDRDDPSVAVAGGRSVVCPR